MEYICDAHLGERLTVCILEEMHYLKNVELENVHHQNILPIVFYMMNRRITLLDYAKYLYLRLKETFIMQTDVNFENLNTGSFNFAQNLLKNIY